MELAKSSTDKPVKGNVITMSGLATKIYKLSLG